MDKLFTMTSAGWILTAKWQNEKFHVVANRRGIVRWAQSPDSLQDAINDLYEKVKDL